MAPPFSAASPTTAPCSITTTDASTAEHSTGDEARHTKDKGRRHAIATDLDEQIEYCIWKPAADKQIALFTAVS